MKKKRYTVEPFAPEKKKTPKELRAERLFRAAVADFLSSISDINNEYGTSYTHEDIFRKGQ